MFKLIENWIERRKLKRWHKECMDERICEATEKKRDIEFHLLVMETERGIHSDEYKMVHRDLNLANRAYCCLWREAVETFGRDFVERHYVGTFNRQF